MRLLKSKILVLLILISLGNSYAQEKFYSNTTNNKSLLNNENSENINQLNQVAFKSLTPASLNMIFNNSEGKFYKVEATDIQFMFEVFNENNENEIINSNSVDGEINKLFVLSIIKRILEKENKSVSFYTNLNAREQLNLNEELYRDYRLTKNKLIAYLKIKDKIELQIGKSLEKDLNKSYLSELDKTLFNSLNLLAINY